jgi:hypothetical protein
MTIRMPRRVWNTREQHGKRNEGPRTTTKETTSGTRTESTTERDATFPAAALFSAVRATASGDGNDPSIGKHETTFTMILVLLVMRMPMTSTRTAISTSLLRNENNSDALRAV